MLKKLIIIPFLLSFLNMSAQKVGNIRPCEGGDGYIPMTVNNTFNCVKRDTSFCVGGDLRTNYINESGTIAFQDIDYGAAICNQILTHYQDTLLNGDIWTYTELNGELQDSFCTKLCEKIPICWKNVYFGLDNNGTECDEDFTIFVRDSEGNLLSFEQMGASNIGLPQSECRPLQLENWINGLNTIFPNSVSRAVAYPNGFFDIPAPNPETDFNLMFGLFLEFTGCDGDNFPTEAFFIKPNGDTSYVSTQLIIGEYNQGYSCNDLYFYEDGTPILEGNLPPCIEECNLIVPQISINQLNDSTITFTPCDSNIVTGVVTCGNPQPLKLKCEGCGSTATNSDLEINLTIN